MSETWTIGELAERAAEALRAEPRLNGRIRDVPTERLIRWYTTIGLVDPPLGRRGRVALYGMRHLLQLVAIKRRQAAGRSIAEIQLELAGATDAALRAIARLGETGPAPAAAAAGPPPADATAPAESAPDGARPTGPPPAGARPARFWAQRPAPPAGGPPAPAAPSPEPPRQARLVPGVRLAPGVTLLLDAAAVPSAADIEAITQAAGPLLAVLRHRGLVEGTPS